MKYKLLLVVNEDRFFLSHRKPVALAALNDGFETIVVAKNTGDKDKILSLGLRFINLPINPTGMNPFQELKTFWSLYRLYRKNKPDVVHHVGMKNILWGGLAAKFCRIPGVVNAVSGLGGLFNNADDLGLVSKMILWLIGFSNNKNQVKFIFQNKDDIRILQSHCAIEKEQIEFTHGSGIDLNEFSYSKFPNNGKIRIIFTGRMVKEKGICNLIEAAEILKHSYKDKVQFLLCGRLTPNKTGISEEYMREHCDGEYICWLGERDDVKQLLENSHIMAFPSYYREGLPKSLIEASAIGRPIVTCDSPGCRDVVEDNINGYLVEPQNPKMLADKLRLLIDDRTLIEHMGQESRRIAERDFSIKLVIDTHLRIYKKLVNRYNTALKIN